jgi:hypothetical protein
VFCSNTRPAGFNRAIQDSLQRSQIEFVVGIEPRPQGFRIVGVGRQQAIGRNDVAAAAPECRQPTNNQVIAQIVETVGVDTVRTGGDRSALRAEHIEAESLSSKHIDGVSSQRDAVSSNIGGGGIGTFEQ